MMAQLRQNPLDPHVLEALRRHCENVGDVTTWAEALEHHARAASLANADPIELGRLHYELGNLYRDRLGRSDRAITHYRTAIDFDAAQRPAIAAARAIFAEAGKWDQVAKLLEHEAESLPEGPKRVALLRERGTLLKKRLDDTQGAIDAFREAHQMGPSDLGIAHELATLLLDQADGSPERAQALGLRREAADILCGMASDVSDDYAFAYAEAALDAVPDHEPALRLLQSLAPRLGRADSIPARWVASLQYAPEGPLSRELRLKLAIAYRTAGQLDDALVCLQPLLDRGDAEAQKLASELAPRGSKLPPAKRASRTPPKSQAPAGATGAPAASERPAAAPTTDRPAPPPETDGPEAPARSATPSSLGGASSLFDLGPDELPHESSNASTDLSAELGTLRAGAKSSPLADLSSLFGGEAAADDERTRVEPSVITDADDADIEDDDSAEVPVPAAAGDAEVSEQEELTTSGAEELRRLMAHEVISTRDEEAVARVSAPEIGSSDLGDSGPPPPPDSDSVPLDSGSVALAQASADEEPVTAPGGASEPGASEQSLARSSAAPAEPTHGDAEQQASSAPTLPPEPAEPEEPPTVVERSESAPVEDLQEETTRPRAESSRASRMPVAAVAQPKTKRESRAPREPEPEPEPENELDQLRRELKRRLRFRDRRGAAELAERLLALGHLEPDAIAALEDQYRMTRDFRRMRDLAMRIAGDLQVPVEQRLTRLREAAMLSESKLGDVDGTIIAWREVLSLVPTDEEANNKLRRLLTRLSRWDDVCQLLAQRAEADTDPLARANRYRELAHLQRDRRKSVPDAISALEQARSLDPDDVNDVTALCELYQTAGRHADAAAAYEWRVAHTEEPVERVPLLLALSDLYENDLSDFDASYRSAEALLAIAPRHTASLDRLLRIDERLERWDQLIRVLEARLLLSDAPGRIKLQTRIAEIALSRLNDPARAADAYASALDLAPDDKALLTQASEAFERAGRREELTESVATAAQHARDATKRFDLYQMLAERREADGDTSAAIAAREAQLAVRRDPDTLRLLVVLLRRTDRGNDLVRRLDELARVEPPSVARELRVERAAVLAEQLSNLEAAKGELQRILDEIAPDDVQVLEQLVDLCRRTEDVPRRAVAQEKLIKLTSALDAKVDLVTDLVETFEKTGDDEGALRVLRTWIGFERDNPQPYLRSAPLLEKSGQRSELLATYDTLARLAMAEDEVGEYQLRGARVALQLEDYDGAWARLVPRVVDADDRAAESLLVDVATQGKRAEALAELYVGLAQRNEGSPSSVERWLDAARTYEVLANNHDKALEAVLRAFAKNLGELSLLNEADRLAELAQAWPRLGQVYDVLVRRAETTAARSAILMRHAKLLEERANDAQAALARATLAFQVDPTDDAPFEEATRLAKALEAHEALLALYERRALAPLPSDAQLTALLAACRTAHVELEDTPRATSYLARSVILADGSDDMLDAIEAHARELDQEHPLPHGRGLVHALSEVYAREAQEGGHPTALTAQLFTRAAHVRDRQLGDLRGAYQALEQASLKRLGDEALLDELLELAGRAGALPALADHLSRRAESAIDSSTASAALIRLGGLYEGPLASHDLAAETFAQLVKLNPLDLEATSRLRAALKAGNKHQELLSTIERQLALSPDPATRLTLLREAAQVWESALGNRFEALDAWRKVQALAPDDAEAGAAIARLKTRPVLDEAALLDADLVVRPEDLRPSLPPEPAPASLPPAASTEEPESAQVAAEQAQHTADAHPPESEPDADAARDSRPLAQSEGPATDAGYAFVPAPTEGVETPAASTESEAAEASPAPDAVPPPSEAEAESEAEPRGPQSLSVDTPVAGAAVLAHLVGEVAALRDDGQDDGRISALERAAYEASHAQANAHRLENDEEPPTVPGDPLELYRQQTESSDEASPPASGNADVGGEAPSGQAATPLHAAPEEEPSTPPADDQGGPEPLDAPPPREAADDDETIGWDRELAPLPPAGNGAPAAAAPISGEEEIELDDDVEEHVEEEPASVDLSALSSIVGGGAARSNKSRIPPPPPASAATRSAPPPPPKGVRPPPPPRRD